MLVSPTRFPAYSWPLGLDSLIAVELRNWLVRELEISLSVIDIADSTSVKDLSDKVAARMVT